MWILTEINYLTTQSWVQSFSWSKGTGTGRDCLFDWAMPRSQTQVFDHDQYLSLIAG